MKDKQEIPVFFTFNQLYVVPAAVAFYSLLKYADRQYRYSLYVLHTELREKDVRLLQGVVKKFDNATLTFIDVSSIPITDEAMKGKGHLSKEVYFKLVAADVFPQYDRILCSDVDVAFKGDIAPSYFLFENEFFYYAGVGGFMKGVKRKKKKHVSWYDDFSPAEREALAHGVGGGYLLLNLKAMRENDMQKTLSHFYLENYQRLPLLEQDTLNICSHPYIKHMPIEYLISNGYYRIKKEDIVFNDESDVLPKGREAMMKTFENALEHPVQIHYVGPFKPWNSFFCSKQQFWFSMLKESGCVGSYIRSVPLYALKRVQRYSLKRFCGKVWRRMK